MNFSKRQGKVRFQIFPYIFVTHEILFKINVTGEFFLKFLCKMESGTPFLSSFWYPHVCTCIVIQYNYMTCVEFNSVRRQVMN